MGDVPLAIGDVVRLKSGSPDLTVTALRDQGECVDVAWFVDEHAFDEVFPADALALKREPATVHQLKRG